MSIDRIPAIREDYPLFSWNDHPDSYAALIRGNEVALFKKETWNAIIDTLKAVLEASGQEWSSTYTSSEVAKITEAYGALSAKMFNSVRHNIDHPAPVGWKWANDKNFRGYVGREDFRGYETHGKESDLFYAEYLLEIVRRLNLLIEIMRGTAPLTDLDYLENIRSSQECNLLAIPVAPLLAESNAESTVENNMVLLKVAPCETGSHAYTISDADVVKIPSAPLQFMDSIKSIYEANAEKLMVAPLYGTYICDTKHEADIVKIRVLDLPNCRELSNSKSESTLFSAKVQDFGGGSAISESDHEAEAYLCIPAPIGSEYRARSSKSADITKALPAPIITSEIAETSHIATANAVPVIGISAETSASSIENVTVDKGRVNLLSGVVESASQSSVSMGFAWKPPVKNGTNLYISHVIGAVKNGKDLRLT